MKTVLYLIRNVDISNFRDLRTRGNWWNLNVSKTLYSARMAKMIARLDQKERRRRAKEIGKADPQRKSLDNEEEEEEDMNGELQTFDLIKTCGDLWG